MEFKSFERDGADELAEFIGGNGHFSTMFDFSAHSLTFGEHGWYDSKPVEFEDLKKVIFHSQLECQGVGFLANIIENHDEPRGANRYLPEYLQNETGIKMLGTISVLLRGIPFLYQGQEIGMRNCRMNSIDEYDDISTKGEYKMAIEAGISEEVALEACFSNSRDNARTPMQWDNTAQAGFTAGTPWLKVNPNYTKINVREQEQRKDSVLSYYKELIALRKSEDFREVFTYGEFIPLLEEEEGILAFVRKTDDKVVRVIANFSENEKKVQLGDNLKSLILLTNVAKEAIQGNSLCLQSGQVVVLE